MLSVPPSPKLHNVIILFITRLLETLHLINTAVAKQGFVKKHALLEFVGENRDISIGNCNINFISSFMQQQQHLEIDCKIKYNADLHRLQLCV